MSSEGSMSISTKALLKAVRAMLPEGWLLQKSAVHQELLLDDEVQYILSSQGTPRVSLTLEQVEGDTAGGASLDVHEEISGALLPGRGSEDLVRLSFEETRSALARIIAFLEHPELAEVAESALASQTEDCTQVPIPEVEQMYPIDAYIAYLEEFSHITIQLAPVVKGDLMGFQSLRVFSKETDYALDIVFYENYAKTAGTESIFIPHAVLGAVVQQSGTELIATNIKIPKIGATMIDKDVLRYSEGNEVLYHLSHRNLEKMLKHFVQVLSQSPETLAKQKKKRPPASKPVVQVQPIMGTPVPQAAPVQPALSALPIPVKVEEGKEISPPVVFPDAIQKELNILQETTPKDIAQLPLTPAHLLEEMFGIQLFSQEVLQDLQRKKIAPRDFFLHPALSGERYAISLFQDFLDLLDHPSFFAWYAGETLSPDEEHNIAGRVDLLGRRLRGLHALREGVQNIENLRFAGHPLRFLQKETLHRAERWLSHQGKEDSLFTRIILPPGLGKTGVAEILSEMLASKKIVYFTSNKGNAQQVIDAYEQQNAFLEAGARKRVAACFGGKFDYTADVLVGMFPTIMAKGEELWKDVDLVYVDEADIIALSAKRSPYLQRLGALGIPIIALSATQVLGNGKHLADLFPEAIIEVETPRGLKACIDRKEAAPLRLSDLIIDTALHVSVRRNHAGSVVLRPSHVDMQWFLSEVLHHYLKEFRQEDGTLLPAGIAVQRNEDAKACVQDALGLGIRAALYTNETPDEERNLLREAMGRGEIDLLVGSDMIGRGMDIPALTVMYNARMTQSPQEFWQTMLRSDRLNPEDPNKIAYAINVLPRAFYNEATQEKLAWTSRPLSVQMFFGETVLPAHNAGAWEQAAGPQGKRSTQEAWFDVALADIVRSSEEVVAQLQLAEKPFDIHNLAHLRLFFGTFMNFVDCFSLPSHAEEYEHNAALRWSFQYKEFFAMLDARYTGHRSQQILSLALDLYGKEYLDYDNIRPATLADLRAQQQSIKGFWKNYFTFSALKACVKNGRIEALEAPYVLHRSGSSYITPQIIAELYGENQCTPSMMRSIIEETYPELITQYVLCIQNKDVLKSLVSLPRMQRIYHEKQFDRIVFTDAEREWRLSVRDLASSFPGLKGKRAEDAVCDHLMTILWPGVEQEVPYDVPLLLQTLRSPLFFVRRGLLINLDQETLTIKGQKMPLRPIAEYIVGPTKERGNEKLIEECVLHLWGPEGVKALWQQVITQKDKEAIIEGIGNWNMFFDERGMLRKVHAVQKIPFRWHGEKHVISGEDLWRMVFGKPYEEYRGSTRIAPEKLLKALLGKERAEVFFQRWCDPMNPEHVRKLLGDPWRFIKINESRYKEEVCPSITVSDLSKVTLEYTDPEGGWTWKWNARAFFLYAFPENSRNITDRQLFLQAVHATLPDVFEEIQRQGKFLVAWF